jgi:bacteriocin biosynthesis cyclodehydratase domain-containing protein
MRVGVLGLDGPRPPSRDCPSPLPSPPMIPTREIQIRKPRIKRTIEVIEAPCGDLHLMRASGKDVRIPNPSEKERSFLVALDGASEVEALIESFGAELVLESIEEMDKLNLLEDAADLDSMPPRELERFDRQLRYLSDVATGQLQPSDCQESLREARVVVLGVGGLGGRIALELSCLGVGELVLVDGDRVELSNFNRQIQFAESEIGDLKAERLADRIRSFNSDISVTWLPLLIQSQEDLANQIAGADLVIDSADWPPHEIEHWCNAACFAAGIPYIAMSHFPPIARIGPLYIPGKTGCFQCQIMRYREEYPLFDTFIEQRKGERSPAATLGPACGVIGGFVGIEVLHFLTGLVKPATQGVGFTFDLRDMTFEREPIEPMADCPVCGGARP